MQSGTIFGYQALANGLLERVRDLMGDFGARGARDTVALSERSEIVSVTQHAATLQDEEDLVFALVVVKRAHGVAGGQP